MRPCATQAVAATRRWQEQCIGPTTTICLWRYRTQDDLDRLSGREDGRLGSARQRVLDERLASQPTQSRLLDALAAVAQNRQALREALGDRVRVPPELLNI